MKYIDPDKIFALFDADDQVIYEEHGYKSLLTNPISILGGVVTGIENYFVIDKIYHLRAPEEYSNIREKIKTKYFSKLFTLLDSINLVELDLKITQSLLGQRKAILKSLQILVDFHEEREEYEKCSKILKIITLFNEKQLEHID